MFRLLSFVLFSSQDAWRAVTAARGGEGRHHRFAAPRPARSQRGLRGPSARAEPRRGWGSGVPGRARPAEARQRLCRSRGTVMGMKSSPGGPSESSLRAEGWLRLSRCSPRAFGARGGQGPAGLRRSPLPAADPRTPRERRGLRLPMAAQA